MSHFPLENALFALFCRYLPHNQRHLQRLAAVCAAVQLARKVHLPFIARYLPQPISRRSRVRFLERFLHAALFQDATFYQLLLQQALRHYRQPIWHLVIDRTNWVPKQLDLLMVSLAYHKRAVPVAWQLQPCGASSSSSQIDLLEKTRRYLPTSQPIILHGDAEFGSVALMQYLTHQVGWEFILGQSSLLRFHTGDWQWQQVSQLPVAPSRPFYAENLFLTRRHNFGPLNLFAFFAPYQLGPHEPQKQFRYFATSLPTARPLRRLGKRRWGCEPMFRDFKSSGWEMAHSALLDPAARLALLQVLAIDYLWAVSLGRWLVKSGQACHFLGQKNDLSAYSGLAGTGSFASIIPCRRSRHGYAFIPDAATFMRKTSPLFRILLWVREPVGFAYPSPFPCWSGPPIHHTIAGDLTIDAVRRPL